MNAGDDDGNRRPNNLIMDSSEESAAVAADSPALSTMVWNHCPLWVEYARELKFSSNNSSRHRRQCAEAPFSFRGKTEHGLDVLTTQLREIGQDCLLIHAARQILEYIGDGDARSLDTGFAAPDAGGNRDVVLPIHNG